MLSILLKKTQSEQLHIFVVSFSEDMLFFDHCLMFVNIHVQGNCVLSFSSSLALCRLPHESVITVDIQLLNSVVFTVFVFCLFPSPLAALCLLALLV